MQQKKTTQEEYQKCVNAVVDYINLHLGEEIEIFGQDFPFLSLLLPPHHESFPG